MRASFPDPSPSPLLTVTTLRQSQFLHTPNYRSALFSPLCLFYFFFFFSSRLPGLMLINKPRGASTSPQCTILKKTIRMMQLARGLRWEIHAIKVWKEEGRQYSPFWGKEREGGGGVVGRKKKADAAKEKNKRIFKERDEAGKPRRGSCGSTCLLRHKCDSAPPGLGET